MPWVHWFWGIKPSQPEDLFMKRSYCMMSADEAAECIEHGHMVFSGFTPAGAPKALPAAIARQPWRITSSKKSFRSVYWPAHLLAPKLMMKWLRLTRSPGARPIRQRLYCGKKSIRVQSVLLTCIQIEVAQMVSYGFGRDWCCSYRSLGDNRWWQGVSQQRHW